MISQLTVTPRARACLQAARHMPASGAPSAADRMLATRLGARAVELIHEGVRNRALGIHDNHIVDVDIKDATAHNENYDQSLYELHSKMNRIY